MQPFLRQKWKDCQPAARQRLSADAAEAKYREDPPTNVVEIIETPWPSGDWLTAIFSMEWRFLLASGGRYFITSDNPAYFFSAFGLATELAELVLPLSSVRALHCSWQRNSTPGLMRAERRCVDEFNNRVASGATRFMFYRGSADWVNEAGKVTTEKLNRINW